MRAAIRPRRLLAAGAAVLATALAGTAAWAYWSATGAGAGSAGSGTIQPVTVTALVAGDQPSSALLPGGTAGVLLRLHNPNAYPVLVGGIAAAGAVTADAGHPGCTATGVTFTPPANPQVSLAAGSTRLVELAAAASMAASSPSACQGATFSIPVTVTAQK
jgi:hypothetical protein